MAVVIQLFPTCEAVPATMSARAFILLVPALLPFRALRGDQLFVPGEEPAPVIDRAVCWQDPDPAALYLYRQRFQELYRDGVMGLLDSVRPLPHERIFPDRIERRDLEASSLFLWCDDATGDLAPLLRNEANPLLEARDRFGCLHQIWPAPDVAPIQAALEGKTLFIADGHHRFAAGWRLATIQIRTPALQTLAAHRLVLDDSTLVMPAIHRIDKLADFWAATPPGFARFGVIFPKQPVRGIEVPCEPEERNISVLHRRVLNSAEVQPVREFERAWESVQSGRAKLAFLVQPLSLDAIENDARRGILLPPKSTDFFPKLAAGLIMHAH